MGQHPGIQVGYVQGAFGIKGWLRIHSFCRPKEQILEYASWDLRLGRLENSYQPDQGRAHGHGVVVHLSGIDTRTQAETLKRARIWVSTRQLAPLPAGEYYWYQLIGLEVNTVSGQGLGKIERLMETGTHDVLVVKGGTSDSEVLIPYLPGEVVKEVDLEHGRMTVDWQLEFS